jgi:hypothetical protein
MPIVARQKPSFSETSILDCMKHALFMTGQTKRLAGLCRKKSQIEPFMQIPIPSRQNHTGLVFASYQLYRLKLPIKCGTDIPTMEPLLILFLHFNAIIAHIITKKIGSWLCMCNMPHSLIAY